MLRLSIDYQRSARFFGFGARWIHSDATTVGRWKHVGSFCEGVAISDPLRCVWTPSVYDDGGAAADVRRGSTRSKDT